MSEFNNSGWDSWDQFLHETALKRQNPVTGWDKLPTEDNLGPEALPNANVLGSLPPDVIQSLVNNAFRTNTIGSGSIEGLLPAGIPMLNTPSGPEGTPGTTAYQVAQGQPQTSQQSTQPTDLMTELGIKHPAARFAFGLGNILAEAGAGMRGQSSPMVDLMHMIEQRKAQQEQHRMQLDQIMGQQKLAQAKFQQDQQQQIMANLQKMQSEAIQVWGMPPGPHRDQLMQSMSRTNPIMRMSVESKTDPRDLESDLEYLQTFEPEAGKQVLQAIANGKPLPFSISRIQELHGAAEKWRTKQAEVQAESKEFEHLQKLYEAGNASTGEKLRLKELAGKYAKTDLQLDELLANTKTAQNKADVSTATKPAEIAKANNEVTKQQADIEHQRASTQHLYQTIRRERLTQFDSVQNEHTFNTLLKEAITMSRKPDSAPPDLSNIDPMAFLMTQSRYASVDEELFKKNLEILAGAAKGEVKDKLLALAGKKPDEKPIEQPKGKVSAEDIIKRHKK